MIINTNLTQCLALNKPSKPVNHTETHNNADYNSAFQGFSVLITEKVTVNKNDSKKTKSSKNGVKLLSPHSQTILSIHHDDILKLQTTTDSNLYS